MSEEEKKDIVDSVGDKLEDIGGKIEDRIEEIGDKVEEGVEELKCACEAHGQVECHTCFSGPAAVEYHAPERKESFGRPSGRESLPPTPCSYSSWACVPHWPCPRHLTMPSG